MIRIGPTMTCQARQISVVPDFLQNISYSRFNKQIVLKCIQEREQMKTDLDEWGR
jgi:hypothetical protein